MYYALLYDAVDGFIERRTPFRSDHLRLAREAHERGELLMAGALADPVDGALLVFSTEDKTIVASFAEADPYVINGLIKAWRVREWTVVVGAR